MVYSINYDLNRPGQDYPGLHDRIKSLGSSWCHPLDSMWFIDTHHDAAAIVKAVRAVLDDNDEILVIRVIKPYEGFAHKDVWTWLGQRL